MKLHIGGVSLFLALSGLPLGIANALDTGVQNLSISQQENTCKGVVKDSKGETIIGASVVVKGTSNGTITDFDGNFSLSNVKKGATIQISFVGFKSQEIVWDGSPISVALKEDTEVLDEVVVIGYGVQKKADLTGSVANVSAEKLNTQSNTTIGQALQGKIAGVDIVSQGGAPGGSTRVMVRGIGTLNRDIQ